MKEIWCRPPGLTSSRIVVGAGAAATLRERAAGRSVFALVDRNVAAAFAHLLAPEWTTLALPGGEAIKTLATAEHVLRAMVQAGLQRDGLLLAIGGGTIGDLGGLCAALFLRGIECWQVPTTWMGMVDSAVGGKTAVNLPEGKNLVGAVHAPALVLVDPTLVRSLPATEFQSGLAEAVKVAIGLDAELFAVLERDVESVRERRLDALLVVAERALAAKASIVESDAREDGARRLLNLGHTLGHALEAHAGFALPHGLGVARGLWFALALAEDQATIAGTDAERSRSLLAAYGFGRSPLPPARDLEPFLRRDKKAAAAGVHCVLPTGIGRSEVRWLPMAELLRTLGGKRA